jgi:hypothetical protein
MPPFFMTQQFVAGSVQPEAVGTLAVARVFA